jgi:hypothetical protein
MIWKHLIVSFVRSSSFTEISMCRVTTPFFRTTKVFNVKFIAYLQVGSTIPSSESRLLTLEKLTS